MKSTILFLLFTVLFPYYVIGQKQEEKTYLILDTDIGMGFDDVGAIAMLHALADSNYVEILAMVSSNGYELSVPCINILNTYYGRPDIPLGVSKNNSAVKVFNNLPVKWPEELARNYPHNTRHNDDVPDAIDVYRKTLTQADDHSVTICSIGFLTNLRDLLLSKSDNHSLLSGAELISRKVKQLVIMGGTFPFGKEFNFLKDSRATEVVTSQWPTEIIFSGSEIGSQVITGHGLAQLNARNNPLKDAYELSVDQSDHYNGMSWDQTAVLVAVKGYTPYYDVVRGVCVTDEYGSNTWMNKEDGRHYYLVPKASTTEVAKIIDDCMKHLPIR